MQVGWVRVICTSIMLHVRTCNSVGCGIGFSPHPLHFLPALRSLSARGRVGVGGCVGSAARARLSGTRAVQRFTLGLCWHWFVTSSWGVALLLSSASPVVVRHGLLGRGYRLLCVVA